jgi:hypothetical protein
MRKGMSKTVSEEEKHIVFSVTMPKNVVKEIDRTRGFMPRTWLKALAINELKKLRGVPAHPANTLSTSTTENSNHEVNRGISNG